MPYLSLGSYFIALYLSLCSGALIEGVPARQHYDQCVPHPAVRGQSGGAAQGSAHLRGRLDTVQSKAPYTVYRVIIAAV